MYAALDAVPIEVAEVIIARQSRSAEGTSDSVVSLAICFHAHAFVCADFVPLILFH
jgi:hypothetical protein